MTGNASRGRLFAQLAKKLRQFFLAVAVDDCRGGQFAPRIHPHVERTVAHDAETALGVFQLSRGDAEIEQCAADARDPKLVEDFSRLERKLH